MKRSHARRRGFTLVETVIALGVIAVMLTTFIGILMPARDSIRRALSSSDGTKAASALSTEMNVVRPTELKAFDSKAFNKAFDWIRQGSSPQTAILVYTYRANLNAVRPDGTYEPYRGTDMIPGRQTVAVIGVRRLDDKLLAADLAAVVDTVFICRLSQLVWNEAEGQYVKGKGGTISSPYGGEQVASADQYVSKPDAQQPWGAEILCLAEFWPVVMPSPKVDALKKFDFDKRNPVFTRDLVFRR